MEVALDGEKGVELFKTGNDFDLVITDIDMPGMDGNEVARHVRASDKSDTPIRGGKGGACESRSRSEEVRYDGHLRQRVSAGVPFSRRKQEGDRHSG